jgi:hypothetical protein
MAQPRVSNVAEQSFIRNDGQWNRQAEFLHRSPGFDLWITTSGFVYDIRRIESIPDRDAAEPSSSALDGESRHDHLPQVRIRRAPLRVTFDETRGDARAYGGRELEEHHNYFIGRDPSRWASHVPLYSDARIEGLYSGIDALFYLDEGRPRYDLVVAPGADPSQISMRIEGATGIDVDGNGALVITTPLGTIEQRGLFAYQSIDGGKQSIPCRFVVGSDGRVGFDLGDYDLSKPLVIDPLVYATYLGGAQFEYGLDIAVDSGRNAYICGATNSPDFPVLDALQSTLVLGYDAFVTKLSSSGARLYSTYMGGGGLSEQATGIAVDQGGNAYLTGSTNATDFPTRNAMQASGGGGMDAFAVRLTAGVTLAYATYLGGSTNDYGLGIALDRNSAVYISGHTASPNFPTRLPLQAGNAGGVDGFVTKLDGAGALSYSTYLGGKEEDSARSIAVDTARTY